MLCDKLEGRDGEVGGRAKKKGKCTHIAGSLCCTTQHCKAIITNNKILKIKPKKKPLYHYYAPCFGFLSKDYMCVCFAGDVKPEIKNQTTCFNNLASTLLLKYHFLFFSPSVDNLKKYRIK